MTRVGWSALAVLIGALVASLLAVSAASAASSDVTVGNCAQLQPVLSNAEPGEVITLAVLCTKSNSGKAEGAFKLPPNVADITIEGQSGVTAGFEGTGVNRSALEGTGNGLVLRNLVVENYSLKEKSAVSLHPTEGALPKLEGDRFVDDVNTDTSGSSAHGGALNISASSSTCAYTAPLSITSSDFDGDRIVDTSANEPVDAGGAVFAELSCNSAATPVDFATLTADTFTGDSIDTATGRSAFGGALYLANRSAAGVLASATQSGDIFQEDTIASTTPTRAYGGGGEWAPSIDLTSTDDRFVGDSLPAPQGSNASSDGAGLGISATCTEPATASAVLENAVFAANTIGASSENGQSAGAGIYAACTQAEPTGHFDLTLEDSTVAGNRAPGGVAGVDGGEADQLALSNSIVTSPAGQADVGGFRTTSGGSLTSSFSDACMPGTSAAIPGEGDICAEPALVGAEAGNVDETSASPTIDAGSNALVPGGLSTDAFGTTARILAGHVGCTTSFPAVVDMGAAELQPAPPSCPPSAQKPVTPPRPGLTHFVRLKTGATGAALTLSCSSTDGLGCSGTIFITTDELLRGRKVVAVSLEGRNKVPVRLAQTTFSLPAGATATIQVKLNSTGLKLLRRFHAISTYLLANEASPVSTPFIFLFHTARFVEPKKHKGKKPKQQGSRHRKHH